MGIPRNAVAGAPTSVAELKEAATQREDCPAAKIVGASSGGSAPKAPELALPDKPELKMQTHIKADAVSPSKTVLGRVAPAEVTATTASAIIEPSLQGPSGTPVTICVPTSKNTFVTICQSLWHNPFLRLCVRFCGFLHYL